MSDIVKDPSAIDAVIREGPFEASWESLSHYRVPGWYEAARFGIFIHWGVYSVPAFGDEWYPRNMYKQGTKEFQHHLDTYGPQAVFGYKDFIPMFKGERFDPVQWAGLFRQAGARYVVPVAEHHDGFAMYDCGFSEWNAVKMGPGRDVIGALADAVRRQSMVFGVSSHRAEHWWFFDEGLKFDSDVRDPRFAGLYGPAQPEFDRLYDVPPNAPDRAFLEDWLARTCELADQYRPQIVYFDWWIEQKAFEPYLKKFAAYYYNRGRQWGLNVAINHKYGAFSEGTAVFDVERGQLKDIRSTLWQTDTSVSRNSWCYIEDHDYKPVGSIIQDLVDIVSKNGTMLLNIGPKPDGTIPEPETEILLAIGRWLDCNGAAIYGARPWKVFGEGPTGVVEGSFTDTKRDRFTSADIRFTSGNDVLYATVLDWPADGEVIIRSLGTHLRLYTDAITSVKLLGSEAPVSWSRDAGALRVRLPDEKPCDHAFVLAIRGGGST